MSVVAALAAVAVADLVQAREFYGRLFGRAPDREPMPGLAQWDIPPSGGFQVVADAERSGSSMATLLVSDFQDFLDRLAGNGITTGDVVTGVLSRLSRIQDPAGNVVTIAEDTISG
jgi:predicted enzyme related to lactoylglutathione lyase